MIRTLRFRDPERVRDAAAGRERRLRRGPDGDAVALPLGDDRARLDRHAVRAVRDVAALDDDVGPRHRGVRVALDDRRVPEHVAVAVDRLVGLVGAPVLSGRAAHPPRSACSGSVIGGSGSYSTSISPSRLRRDLRRHRRDGGDDVGLEAHLLLREQAAVLDHLAVEHVGHVLVREDGEHAGQRPRLRGVDRW